MVFLIRDWYNYREYPHGLKGGKSYLDIMLQVGREGEGEGRKK